MQGRSDASGSDSQMSDPFFQKSDVTDVLPFILKEQQALKPYMAMVEQLPSVNAMNAPLYMSEFLKAKEIASRFYANAVYRYESAHREKKAQHSIAKFDRAPDFLAKKGLKYSDAAGSAYADMDVIYRKAAEEEAYWLALREYFNNLIFKFNSAFEATKRIYDQTKDPRGSVSALPSGHEKE